MARTAKILAESNPSASSLTDAYTVPASTTAMITSIDVCNFSSSAVANITVKIAVAGLADTNKQYTYFFTLDKQDTLERTCGIPLQTTDVVRVMADTANVSFQIYGIEYS